MTDEVRHEDLPAAPGGQAVVDVDHSGSTVHDHPLPSWVRTLAFLYGCGILLFGGLDTLDRIQSEERDRQVTAGILAQIDRRTASRLENEKRVDEQLAKQEAEAAARSAATTTTICALLNSDFEPTPTVIAVARQLRCPTIPQ